MQRVHERWQQVRPGEHATHMSPSQTWQLGWEQDREDEGMVWRKSKTIRAGRDMRNAYLILDSLNKNRRLI